MGTVSLTVDYGNGSQKLFTTIPWKKGLTVLEALGDAQKIPPGLDIQSGTGRAGQVINLRLDGLPDLEGSDEWFFSVNGRKVARLETRQGIDLRPETRAENQVGAGEHIVAELVRGPAASP